MTDELKIKELEERVKKLEERQELSPNPWPYIPIYIPYYPEPLRPIRYWYPSEPYYTITSGDSIPNIGQAIF